MDVDVSSAGGRLVLACDLARRGVACRIVEANPAPPDHRSGSRGKGIQPRTLEVYDDLGIIDAVHEAGGPYYPAMAWDGPKPLGPAKFHRIERREPSPDVPYPSMWMLLQPRALDILRARLPELGGRVEFGTRLVGVHARTPMASPRRCSIPMGARRPCARTISPAATARAASFAPASGVRIRERDHRPASDDHRRRRGGGAGAHALAHVGQREGRGALARAAGADQCVPALRQVRGRGAGPFARGAAQARARAHRPPGAERDRGARTPRTSVRAPASPSTSASAGRSWSATPPMCIRRPAGRA